MTHIERLGFPFGERDVHASMARRLAEQIPGLHRPRIFRGKRLEVAVDAPWIDTERLTLRPHRVQDAEAWYRLQSDPRTVAYLAWDLRNREESRQHLRDRSRQTRLWQADDFMALAIEHEGSLIGDVSLHLRDVDAAQRSAEIGWVIDPEQGGHGYATEAAEAVVGFAFDQLAATKVMAVIERRNFRSLALARRLGFTLSESSPTHITLAIRPDGV